MEDGSRSGGQLEILDLEASEIISHYSGSYICNSGSLWSSNSLHDCVTLQEIVFGKSLSSVSGRDFSGCISLRRIDVKDNPRYKSIEGVLYQYADNCDWTTSTRTPFGDGKWILIKVPATIQDSSLIKFDKINRIDDKAFEDTSLKSIIMPEVPPMCAHEAFAGVDPTTVTLLVPKESINSYWCHPVWGQFVIKAITEK